MAYAHMPETCPSKHHNPGDDICSDCGVYPVLCSNHTKSGDAHSRIGGCEVIGSRPSTVVDCAASVNRRMTPVCLTRALNENQDGLSAGVRS